MKIRTSRFITILSICAICALPAVSAIFFKVFKTEGDVCLIKDGKKTALEPRTDVSYKDEIKIGKNSRIGIKDNTNRIYYSTTPGKTTVIEIVQEARKNSGAASTAAKKILEEETQRKYSRVLGVVNRGCADFSGYAPKPEKPEPAVPAPDTFGWAIQRINAGIDSVSADCKYPVQLTVNVSKPDSVVTYTIEYADTNDGTVADTNNKVLFVNVIRIECAGRYDIGQNFDLMLSADSDGGTPGIRPGETLNIDWEPSIMTPRSRYYLLVSEINFSPEIAYNVPLRMKSTGAVVRPQEVTANEWNAPTWILPARIK